MDRRIIPIIISGGGPVGLTLSSLLSRYGVRNVVLEKNVTLPDHPQAHFINCRTMEIFRHAFPPKLYQGIQAIIPPLRYWRHFVYQTRVLGGVEIGRVDHFDERGVPASILKRSSPSHVAHLSQKRLQPLLFKAVQEAGAEIKLGWEVNGFEDGEGGNIRVLALDKASGESHTLDCKYLIAADGASSPLRQLANVQMEGPAGIQYLMNVHFSSRELAKITDGRPAMLHFIYNKDVVCVLVAHHFESGEFVAQVPFFPPAQLPEDFDDLQVHTLLESAIGQRLSDLQVHSVRPWTMDCQVADRYRCGPHRNVFLVGDSGHRFPPAGGFGMNTGIQDAHNLAWKLALVVKQLCKDSLLDSYEAERRPIAISNSQLSLANFERSLRVPNALGLDASHPKAIAQAVGRIPKHLFEMLLASGRRPLASLEQHGQPYGKACLDAARKVLQDGAGLPLLFPLQDLGFRYSFRGTTFQLSQDNASHSNMLDRHMDLCPGGRMPHLVLKIPGPDQRWLSMTDLPDQLYVALSSWKKTLAPFAVLTAPEGCTLGIGPNAYLSLSPFGEGQHLPDDVKEKIPIVEVEILGSVSEGKKGRPSHTVHDDTKKPQMSTLTEAQEALLEALGKDISGKGHVIKLIDELGHWRQALTECNEKRENVGMILRPDGYIIGIGTMEDLSKKIGHS